MQGSAQHSIRFHWSRTWAMEIRPLRIGSHMLADVSEFTEIIFGNPTRSNNSRNMQLCSSEHKPHETDQVHMKANMIMHALALAQLLGILGCAS
jgi:hypothetical protein